VISSSSPNSSPSPYKDSRQEIDDFFFNSDTLPDISKTNVNQITSANNHINNNNNNNNNLKKSKSQTSLQQRPLSSLNLSNNKSSSIDKLNSTINYLKNESNLLNTNTNININTSTTPITTNNTSKNGNTNSNHQLQKTRDVKKDSSQYPPPPSSKNLYEENEEWLLKNTDKLLRNLFDRQKKWEDTRVRPIFFFSIFNKNNIIYNI